MKLFPVPSAPPENVQIEIVNTTAAYVRWAPPPSDHHNGVLQGYKVNILVPYFRFEQRLVTGH